MQKNIAEKRAKAYHESGLRFKKVAREGILQKLTLELGKNQAWGYPGQDCCRQRSVQLELSKPHKR